MNSQMVIIAKEKKSKEGGIRIGRRESCFKIWYVRRVKQIRFESRLERGKDVTIVLSWE